MKKHKKLISLLVIIPLTLAFALGYIYSGNFSKVSPIHAATSDPSGNGIVPVFVEDNPSCEDLGYDIGFKPSPEDGPNGTYSDGILEVTTSNNDGTYFDWSSNIGVDAVIVKGGPNANAYVYDPPEESTGDTDLHSPINPNNDKPYGLSHIEFCYDVVPSVHVEKSGDELSKVGDDVNYTITITNDGDLPINLVSVTDVGFGWTGLGDLTTLADDNDCDVLLPGEYCAFVVPYTVQEEDPDPMENEVTVVYDGVYPDEEPFEVEYSDTHSVNLFQPSVTIEKTGNEYSKHGDTVDYTITVNNTSSDDTPLLDCTLTDSMLGVDKLIANFGYGAQDVTNVPYVVSEPPDTDPLINTAYLECNVQGFPNILEESDSHEVDLVHPDFTVTKDCLTETVPPGGTAIFEVTIENTGDIPLHIETDEDDIPPFDIEVAETRTFEVTQIAGPEGIVENEVTVTATLPEIYNLSNVIEKSASDYCDVEEEGATRTPGFWKTHYDYTTHVFEEHLGGSIDLGWKTISSTEDLFGIYWANKAKDSDNKKRSRTCQAQILGSFHLLSAILNAALDNGSSVPIDPETTLDLITAMRNALSSGDRDEILRLVPLLDEYNNSGDDVAIIDSHGEPIGNADPNMAKDVADFSAGDC
jgi:uncharacterized repeat protein (TIGR01451 family)